MEARDEDRHFADLGSGSFKLGASEGQGNPWKVSLEMHRFMSLWIDADMDMGVGGIFEGERKVRSGAKTGRETDRMAG